MTTTHDVPMPEPRFTVHWHPYRCEYVINPGRPDGEPGYTAAQLRAYADARCAKLQEERDGKQKQIHRRANAMNAVYDELQRVAPWSESNDMDWADEMIAGINLLAQERDALAEKVKYWRQRAKSAEGHLPCADIDEAAKAVHMTSNLSATPWAELRRDQQIACQIAASAAVRAINASRDARKPKDAAIDAAGDQP